jgi:hypothetical protein
MWSLLASSFSIPANLELLLQKTAHFLYFRHAELLVPPGD